MFALICVIAFAVFVWLIFRKPYDIYDVKATPITSEPEAFTPGIDHHARAKDAVPIKLAARITYRDADGDTTERNIWIHSMFPRNGEIVLSAKCLLRNDYRTFFVSRMQQFVDLSTGEEVGDVSYYLSSRYGALPTSKVDDFYDRHNAELVILAFVSRADGRLVAKERSEIAEHFTRLHPGDAFDPNQLEEYVKALRPSVSKYRASLNEIAGCPKNTRDHLLDSLHRIAGSKKAPDALTLGAVALAEDVLKAS